MAKKQRKKKRRQSQDPFVKKLIQQDRSEAVVAELEVAELQWAIKRLKQMPNDFRDMIVLGKDWRDFEEIMGREKKDEMRRWAKGGVLCLQEPSEMELKVLEGYGKVMHNRFNESNSERSMKLLGHMCDFAEASFIYASDWPPAAITGMNALASYYKWNYRFKGQLMSERKGVPLGIQV